MAASIHVGDTPTFEATLKDEDGAIVDVSSASVMQMVFNKPDGTAVVKDAALSTDGTDGKIKYESTNTDIDQVGHWQVQGYAKVGSDENNSDIHAFEVYPNLPRT